MVENSFIGRNAHRMLRRNYNSDESGSEDPKQITYVPKSQSLYIWSVLHKIESGQAKEIIANILADRSPSKKSVIKMVNNVGP